MFLKNPLRLYSQIYDVPFPLELSSYDTCSQMCSYCFVNRGREAHGKDTIAAMKEKWTYDPTIGVIQKFAKSFSDAYNDKDPVEYFIRNKYPIVYSNTTDPFCSLELKTRSAEKLLHMFADYQYPVFLQTKNPYIEEYLPILEANKNNILYYVSLSTLDDAKNKIIEKNSTPPSVRIAKIKELIRRGFSVNVALNPYFEGISPEVEDYVKFMADLGVDGIWFDYLHLSYNQRKSVKKIREEHIIPYADIPESRQLEVFERFVAACREQGLNYECNAFFSEKLGYFDDAPYLNSKFDKVSEFCVSYISKCLHENWLRLGKKPMLVTWDSFRQMIDSEILTHVFSTHKFFSMMNNTVVMSQPRWNVALGAENSLENMLKYAWNNHEEIMTWVWGLTAAHLLCNYDQEDGEVWETKLAGNSIMVYHEDKSIEKQFEFFIEDWSGEISTL